jgi:hypothetical protein
LPRQQIVIVQAWGAATAIVAGSLLIGHAINLIGCRCRAASPAVGFALLIVIASAAIKLPGKAVTAAIILLVVIAACGVLAILRRGPWRFPGVPVATILIAAFGAAIPFIANGRVGLPGVGLDNDTRGHLVYAEGLRSSVSRALYGVPNYYPLGPHSLAATVASGLGVRLDLAFTGLLIATVVLTALVGANALRSEAGWKRVVTGSLAGLLYLVAAYYAEAAFKETILGLLLLAFALHFEEVRGEWATGSPGLWRVLAPAAVLVAAGVYVYSYPAIAWFGVTVVIWIAAEALLRPVGPTQWRTRVRALLLPVVIAGGVLLVLVLPIAGEVRNLLNTFGLSAASTGAIATSNLGNLAHALSPFEALGIWNDVDFRLIPADVFHAGLLSAFALAVLALGVGWSLARRELLLPAAVAACWIIYWRANQGESPYISAKALVIAGPVIAVTGMGGLVGRPLRSLTPWLAVPRALAAVAFIVFAAHSSYLALANEPVWGSESTRELLAFDKLTSGQTVLFLGATDYTEWLFHDSRVSALAPQSTSLAQAGPRLTKSNVYGSALDFDSVNPVNLNSFQWFVTTNTPFNSQPPAGVRLVRQLPMYQLWERVGMIPTRQTIEPPGAPGAILDCHTRAGRAVSDKRGAAAVMTPPVIRPVGATLPGKTVRVSLPLPPGEWALSLQYVSPVNLELSAAGRRWSMPAYTDRPGPVFVAGTIDSTGTPTIVGVHADKPSPLTGSNLLAAVTAVIATRAPNTRVVIPLTQSCGRYVDWYTT